MNNGQSRDLLLCTRAAPINQHRPIITCFDSIGTHYIWPISWTDHNLMTSAREDVHDVWRHKWFGAAVMEMLWRFKKQWKMSYLSCMFFMMIWWMDVVFNSRFSEARIDLHITLHLNDFWFFKVDFYVMKVKSKSTSLWWRHKWTNKSGAVTNTLCTAMRYDTALHTWLLHL